MAVETDNLIHAIAGVVCSNPPSIPAVYNRGLTTIRRAAVGVYVLGLKEKLDGNTDGLCHVTPSAGTAVIVSGRVLPYDPLNPDDNIEINAFDLAGDAADIGEVTLTVWHLPTIS